VDKESFFLILFEQSELGLIIGSRKSALRALDKIELHDHVT